MRRRDGARPGDGVWAHRAVARGVPYVTVDLQQDLVGQRHGVAAVVAPDAGGRPLRMLSTKSLISSAKASTPGNCSVSRGKCSSKRPVLP